MAREVGMAWSPGMVSTSSFTWRFLGQQSSWAAPAREGLRVGVPRAPAHSESVAPGAAAWANAPPCPLPGTKTAVLVDYDRRGAVLHLQICHTSRAHLSR